MAISEIDFDSALRRMIRDDLVDAINEAYKPMTLSDLKGVDPAYSMEAVAIAKAYNAAQARERDNILESLDDCFHTLHGLRTVAVNEINALKK
jgi:hypothetical protein